MSNFIGYLILAGFLVWGVGGLILFNWGMNLATSLGFDGSPLMTLPVIGWVYLVWMVWTTTGVFFSAFTIAFLGWIAMILLLGMILQRR
jgi:hypothetical protein